MCLLSGQFYGLYGIKLEILHGGGQDWYFSTLRDHHLSFSHQELVYGIA